MERWQADAFDGERLNRPGTWGVCFAADWCPFCVEFLREFHAVDGQTKFPLAIADMTDLESPLWERFHLEVVPTLIVFREGTAVWRKDGTYMVGLRAADLRELREVLSK